ncbi:hypothetical protein ACWEV4_34125 [Streptomyces sp. NPDC003860]
MTAIARAAPATSTDRLEKVERDLLLADLNVVERIVRSRPSTPAALSMAWRALTQQRARWLPMVASCRAAEAQSATALAAWDDLLTEVRRPRARTARGVQALACTLQHLLTAVARATAPGPDLAAVTRLLADDLGQGDLAPGSPLKAREISIRTGWEQTRVQVALADLVERGLVKRHQKAFVAAASPQALAQQYAYVAEVISALITEDRKSGGEGKRVEGGG